GEGFGQFIERELLQPLGMTSSRVHDSRGAAVPGRALAYAETGHGYSVIFPRNEIVGGAKLYTTVEDLLRWERNFHEPVVGGRALMDALVARPRLASGATIPYASGLRIGEYRGLPTVHRSGGGTFASEMLRFPEQRLAVVTLCNTSASHPRYLSQEVAALYLAEQMQSLAVVPARRQVETPQDELVRYAGVYRPLETPWNILRIAARDGALQEVFPDSGWYCQSMSLSKYSSAFPSRSCGSRRPPHWRNSPAASTARSWTRPGAAVPRWRGAGTGHADVCRRQAADGGVRRGHRRFS
ncbi:MAG: beta-lactamase family protein, partial [Acidobacteria bacterium]|nr:beta-lactamase family protein [Acidobacteriota bacterium]